MADDNSTFIREVNEDLRSDYMKALWKRFRFVILAVAVGIVAITAGLRGWEYWKETTAARSGDAFLAALDEHQPDILGMSALLTTTMPYMKVVVDTLTERGLRDKYLVLVGGAPLNEEFGHAVGADAYCRDAAVAAETAKQLVSARRGNPEPPGPAA